MKKFFGFIAACSLLFTSCLSDSEATGQLWGYFTVENNTNEVILHMDGGGTYYPTSSSVYELTDGKGFGSLKRCTFYLTYPESGLTKDSDGMPIARNVTINSGEEVYTINALTPTAAEAQNIYANDSINEVTSLQSLWIYNGYLTTVYQTKYISRSSASVYPTLNLVIAEGEKGGEINATLLLNLHRQDDKDVLSTTTVNLAKSFDISSFGYEFQKFGSDSVTVNIKCQGIKDYSFKVAAKEAFHRF